MDWGWGGRGGEWGRSCVATSLRNTYIIMTMETTASDAQPGLCQWTLCIGSTSQRHLKHGTADKYVTCIIYLKWDKFPWNSCPCRNKDFSCAAGWEVSDRRWLRAVLVTPRAQKRPASHRELVRDFKTPAGIIQQHNVALFLFFIFVFVLSLSLSLSSCFPAPPPSSSEPSKKEV